MIRVPEMTPCEVCGLEVEDGNGPGGKAWHSCQQFMDAIEGAEAAPTKLSQEQFLQQVMAGVVEAMGSGAPKVGELADVIRAIAELRSSEGGGSDVSALRAFITRKS